MAESVFFSSWELFSKALLDRFGPSAYDDPMEALTRLKKTFSVEDFKEKFEAISNRLRGISDHNYRHSNMSFPNSNVQKFASPSGNQQAGLGRDVKSPSSSAENFSRKAYVIIVILSGSRA